MGDNIDFAELIWKIADLLRGPYGPTEYGNVILPMTVLRRLDCVLAPTKAKVLADHERLKNMLENGGLDAKLNAAAGQHFHNHSPLSFDRLKKEPDRIAPNLISYIQGFSTDVRSIFRRFGFENEIKKLHGESILYPVVVRFCDVNLHPDGIPNERMGLIFENLIRRSNELTSETAGDHFTPREVIRLMVKLLFANDDALLEIPGMERTLLDTACGTGGMLAEAQNYLRNHHPETRLHVFGQDRNEHAFAIAASDILMKQTNGGDSIQFGDSFTDDKFYGQTFDYFLTNPSFGVSWKEQQHEIRHEHKTEGMSGRFGVGLPRVTESSLLFLQHLTKKFERFAPGEHKFGSRGAIVFRGSTLSGGGAGSGESEIRRWIIEKDWLEAVIALPEQIFQSTDIGTYVWILTNRKEELRQGRIQLVDARELWTPGGSPESNRNLGNKRRHIAANQIEEIVGIYRRFENGERSRFFDNVHFGYTCITVERPLRLCYQMTVENKARFLDACPGLLDDVQEIDKVLGRDPISDWNAVWQRIANLLDKRRSRWNAPEKKLFRSVFTSTDPDAEAVLRDGGGYEPDPALRDFENVPLKQDVDAYFEDAVRPRVPDVWIDRSKDKVGYQIAFHCHFRRSEGNS